MFGNRQILSKGFYEKLFIKSSLFIVTLSLSGFSAFGQNKTEDYQKIIEAAYQKLPGISYRLKSLKEISDGFTGSHTTTISEFVPPDRSSEIKTTEYWTDVEGLADRPEKFQNITIGKKKFVNIDAEVWRETSETENAKLKRFPDYFLLKDLTYPIKDLTIKKTGQENLSDQTIAIYKANYTADNNAYEVSYWINTDGLLVKTEYKTMFKGRIESRIERRIVLMTETYEYDANIKIEAPKLN